MLTPTQLFRAGFNSGAPLFPADLSAFLELIGSVEFSEQFEKTDWAALPGFTSAARTLFPDSPQWTDEPGSSLLAKLEAAGAPLETPEWNAYFVARFAYLGRDADLAELVRRARHRDGSTMAIVTGSEVIALLISVSADVPELRPKLLALGLDLASVKTAFLPAVPPASSPVLTSGAGASLTVATPPAVLVVPAGGPELVQTLPAAAMGSNAGGKMLAGVDLENGVITLFNMSLNATAALAALSSLVEATQKLLIPVEGYLWVDELEHTAAALVCLDSYTAKKLSLPERSGELALRAGVDTVFLHGMVNQSTEAGVQFGHYKCQMFQGSGFEEFGDFTDFNDAKVELAKRVRRMIEALPG